MTLEIIWKKFEEFCKPQANKLRTRFDLLTSFRQAEMSVNEWYIAVKSQVALAKYPQETAQILQRYIFWFFLKDKSFVLKTLNERHVELSNFPVSAVCQLAKKMESSQTTAKYMKQVTREPQTLQVNLLQHQCTEIPPSKSKKKNETSKFRQETNKFMMRNQETHKKIEDLIMSIQDKIYVKNVVTPPIKKGLAVQQASTSVRFVINLATSVACATGKEINMIITKGP